VRILFGIRHDGADAYFRAIAPASVLRYQGIDAYARGVSLEDADEFDLLVLQRQCSPATEIIMRAFQEKGKAVIYDVDDWLFGIPPFWPAYSDYRVRGSGEPTDLLVMHERLLGLADAVTCTGPTLGEKLRAYNDRIYIVPNCVLWADWDVVIPLERNVDGPVIGWFGMPYYWDSWRIIAPAVEQAVFEVGGTLSILGYPEVVATLSPRLAANTFVQLMTVWKQFNHLRRLISTFDVGIAWLEDTPFNRCKSPLKVLQYGAAGVPVVASPMPYSEALGDEYPEQYGIVAPAPDALYRGIVKAATCREPARLRAEAWRLQVFRKHTYETQWRAWEKVIMEGARD